MASPRRSPRKKKEKEVESEEEKTVISETDTSIEGKNSGGSTEVISIYWTFNLKRRHGKSIVVVVRDSFQQTSWYVTIICSIWLYLATRCKIATMWALSCSRIFYSGHSHDYGKPARHISPCVLKKEMPVIWNLPLELYQGISFFDLIFRISTMFAKSHADILLYFNYLTHYRPKITRFSGDNGLKCISKTHVLSGSSSRDCWAEKSWKTQQAKEGWRKEGFY